LSGGAKRFQPAMAAWRRSMSSQALVYAKRSSPITLTVETPAVGTPAANQVAIKFLASSVSYSDFPIISGSAKGTTGLPVKDMKVRFAKAKSVGPIDPAAGPIGPKFPKTPAVGGLEGVAVVQAVGSSVSGMSVGDWVVPSTAVGSWQTDALVGQEELVKIRNDISAPHAACLSISPVTALQLLESANLKEDDVMIHNAANGLVGQTLVQLAAARGIKVISVVRHKASLAFVSDHLKDLGSAAVVPVEFVRSHYFNEMLAEFGTPKVAFDGVGGESGSAIARCMPKGGSVVCYGGGSGEPLILPAEKDLKVSAFYHSEWVAKAGAAGRAKAINTLADMLAEKKLRFLVEVGKFDNHRTSLNAAFEAMRNRRFVLSFPGMPVLKEYENYMKVM